MPKFPYYAQRTKLVGGSVFEKFRGKLEAQGDNLVKLHIGDSYAPPPYDLPFEKQFVDGHPGFNRYCDTFGIAPLREALAEKLRADNNIDGNPGRILVTAGATNALSVSVQSLVDPGDEVMLLAPYWPFFRGMVLLAGGSVVETPLYTVLYDQPGLDIRAHLEQHLSERTVAIYLNSPNNPSGKVLDRAQLETVASFARDHDLWLISDEAYDGMTFDGREHVSPASFPGMLERTVTMFTFSKVFMFSGIRIGYAVGSEDTVRTLNKTMVHQLYSPSTVAQQMLVEPVRTRTEWRHRFVRHIQELRDEFSERVHMPMPTPDGAYYFFFSIADRLGGRDYWEVFDACMDAGVSVAPGADFGAEFGRHIRICFAGESPERLRTAAERLNRVFPQ